MIARALKGIFVFFCLVVFLAWTVILVLEFGVSRGWWM